MNSTSAVHLATSAPTPGSDGEGPSAESAMPISRQRLWPRVLRRCVTVLLRSTEPARPLFTGFGRGSSHVQPYAAALIVAGVLGWLGYQPLINIYGLQRPAALVLAAVQAAPVLLAVTRPLPAWWIMTAANLAATPVLLHQLQHNPGAGWPWSVEAIVGQLLLLIALVMRERTATLVAVWAILTVLSYGLAWAYPQYNDGSDSAMVAFGSLILLVGWAVRERRRAEQRLFEQRLAGQSERARIALLEERAQIARELHDVVAHHMSVITVQAESAPYRIEDLPPQAGIEFADIAASARGALLEMRRLLGVLRSEQDADSELAPQPGLDRIPELLATAVRAGVLAELHTDGLAADPGSDAGPAPGSDPGSDPGQLAPGVELAVFRVVQESLANVVRHAPGARARIEISMGEQELSVRIVNSPPTAPTPKTPLETEADVSTGYVSTGHVSTGYVSTGHGLIGMRERIRLVGGILEAGPTPGGGFRVAARIPHPKPGAPTQGQHSDSAQGGAA